MDWKERADWSDRFFNYVPATNTCGEYWSQFEDGIPAYMDDPDLAKLLLREAVKFVDAYQECPMTVSDLATDFISRL